jgi:hypothetical protein
MPFVLRAGLRGFREGEGAGACRPSENLTRMGNSSGPSADEDVVAAAVAIIDIGSKDLDVRVELGETYQAAKSYLTSLFKAAQADELA